MIKNLIFRKDIFRSFRPLQRSFKEIKSQYMLSWQILEYGGIDKLVLSDNVSIPFITQPSDVLVEVKAASVNPIDLKMINGYGAPVFNQLKKVASLNLNHPEFPLTLGRDFSGTIIDQGSAVPSSFKINDEVWGTVNVDQQGSFSQYIVIPFSSIAHKPPSLSTTEAASMPYIASTLWNALSPLCGHIEEKDLFDKRVLVVGGSGGVGTYAIQFFNGYGAEVTTTVPTDFVARAAELGATNVVDYHRMDARFLVEGYGKFNLILDLVNSPSERLSFLSMLRPSARYVTINFPFFSFVKNNGLLLGGARTAYQLATEVAQGLRHGTLVSWGHYAPSKRALDAAYQLVEEEKVRPVMERVYPMEQLPEAMNKVMMGHNRGKTVIDFEL